MRAASPPLASSPETARRAEAIGIDTLVIPDHLIPQLAPVPTMAVIAAVSDRLRISAFVLNNDLRHPAVLAQDLASLDVLSEGRLDVAMGRLEPCGVRGDRPAIRPDSDPPGAAGRGDRGAQGLLRRWTVQLRWRPLHDHRLRRPAQAGAEAASADPHRRRRAPHAHAGRQGGDISSASRRASCPTGFRTRRRSRSRVRARRSAGCARRQATGSTRWS